MKRIVSLLIALLVIVGCAVAEDRPFSLFPDLPDVIIETPAPDEEAPEAEAPDVEPSPAPFEAVPTPTPEAPGKSGARSDELVCTIDGNRVKLEFDPDPAYSSRELGYITACFYGDLRGTEYEVYFVFPDTIGSGDIVSDATAAAGGDDESGIMLFITQGDDERSAMASQYSEGAFPEGSAYAIEFTEADSAGAKWTFAGTVSAELVEVDELFNPSGSLTLEGSFRFSGAFGDDDRGGNDDYGGYDDDYGLPPTPPPYLTIPDDAQKI